MLEDTVEVPDSRSLLHFEGMHRFSPKELLSYLHVGEHSWLPFTREYQYDEAAAAADAARVEDVYRSFGYRQARVLQVLPVPHPGHPEQVDLLVRIEEGQPTRVTRLDFIWAASVLSEAEQHRVEASATLHEGGPFEIERLNGTLGDLRLELLRQGFPLATSAGSADVHEGARRAEVQLRIVPGPRARIGKIRFEGLWG
ncbi:MAG: POTRA domain-containing protein [Polyangiaceae bacterium]